MKRKLAIALSAWMLASVCISCSPKTTGKNEGESYYDPNAGINREVLEGNVVENGVLKTLLYDLTTAGKAGKSSTGNGQKAGYSSPVGIAPYNGFFDSQRAGHVLPLR